MIQNKQQKLLFRKLLLAAQLIQTVPIKFKKKIRQLIQQYQNERIQLLRKINPSLYDNKKTKSENLNPNYNSVQQQQLKKQIQILKGKNYEIQQQKIRVMQENFNIKFKWQQTQIQTQAKQSELIQLKNTILYLQQNIDYSVIQFKHKIQQLTAQLNLVRQQLQQSIERINELIHKYNLASKNLQEKNQQLIKNKQNLQKLQKHNKSLQNQLKKNKTLQISMKIKNNHDQFLINSPINTLEPLQILRRKTSSRKPTDNPFLFIMNNSANTPPKTSSKKLTLNESLKMAKTHFSNNKQSSDEFSETESIQFGKQKVVQKKRLKKMFIDLMKAQNDQKKIIIDRIGGQIGLRQKQLEQFTSLINL